MAYLQIDTREIQALAQGLEALPPRMARQVLGRALGRSLGKVEREYARLAHRRIGVPVGVIRKLVKARSKDDFVSLFIRSQNIPLYKLGARQGKAGVSIRERGLYPQSFLATMKNGKRGVFIRDPAGGGKRVPRLGITELFGPNPAAEVLRNEGVYQALLREQFDAEFMRQIEQGVTGMLKKLAAR